MRQAWWEGGGVALEVQDGHVSCRGRDVRRSTDDALEEFEAGPVT